MELHQMAVGAEYLLNSFCMEAKRQIKEKRFDGRWSKTLLGICNIQLPKSCQLWDFMTPVFVIALA